MYTEAIDLEPGEAVLVDWPTDRYHADQTCVSNSWLSVLIDDGPATYRAKRDGLIEFKPTAAMIFGTHVHLALLEPDEWKRRLFDPEPVKPKGARGNAKKKDPEGFALYSKWKRDLDEWGLDLEATPDAIVLNDYDWARVDECAAAVRSHGVVDGGVELGSASWVLSLPNKREQTVIWRHDETGILMRSRIDLLADSDAKTVVVFDLKTTTDPSPGAFGRSVANYGYHRQGAIYTDAIRALRPDAEVHFVIAAVRSKPPFEVACRHIEREELEQGRREYERALRDLKRRRDDDDWLAPWQRGIHRQHMPRWAYDKDEDR